MIEGERIVPPVNVSENFDSFIIEMYLPGVRIDEIEITAGDEEIIIIGAKKQEEDLENRVYYLLEREFGHFRRIIKLPSPFNKRNIKAFMKEGVLRIYVPKIVERRSKYIKIPIKEE